MNIGFSVKMHKYSKILVGKKTLTVHGTAISSNKLPNTGHNTAHMLIPLAATAGLGITTLIHA